MTQHTSTNNNGFTFIEVLVSVSIMAFIVIGVMSMTSVHIQTNAVALYKTKATQLAEESIERFLRVDFTTLAAGIVKENLGTIDNFSYFARRETISFIDVDNYRMTVRVTWRDFVNNPTVLSIVRTRQ